MIIGIARNIRLKIGFKYNDHEGRRIMYIYRDGQRHYLPFLVLRTASFEEWKEQRAQHGEIITQEQIEQHQHDNYYEISVD